MAFLPARQSRGWLRQYALQCFILPNDDGVRKGVLICAMAPLYGLVPDIGYLAASACIGKIRWESFWRKKGRLPILQKMRLLPNSAQVRPTKLKRLYRMWLAESAPLIAAQALLGCHHMRWLPLITAMRYSQRRNLYKYQGLVLV